MNEDPIPRHRDYGRAVLSIGITAFVGFATWGMIHWLVHFRH
jgi:hypothetical protein